MQRYNDKHLLHWLPIIPNCVTCLVRKNQMYITCRKKIYTYVNCVPWLYCKTYFKKDCTYKGFTFDITYTSVCLFLKKIWQSNTPVSSYDGITSLCICPSKSVARKCCLRKLWDRCCMRGTVILYFLPLLNEYLSLMYLILSM